MRMSEDLYGFFNVQPQKSRPCCSKFSNFLQRNFGDGSKFYTYVFSIYLEYVNMKYDLIQQSK